MAGAATEAQGELLPENAAQELVAGASQEPGEAGLLLVQELLQQEPGAEPEPGRPVQLVRLDEEGGLTLDEGALSCCLEQGRVGNAPVCLVSVIGEQRRGKSFLLNYLLRRLRSPGTSDESWMGQEEEPLKGFEWRADEQQVTTGVWAWSQPLWVPADGGQVAVLLVDTEGSMDVERNKETSIKLSALSMLLSSYQILNIGCRVKDPDLEYLEMFLQVAEVVGKEYGLEPVQHLDLLVRDWSSSQFLGVQGGEKHLRDVQQGLAAMCPCKHPKALDVLSRSSSRCYLMPYPGKRIATGIVGALRDMDEDFRESLRDYVTALVGSAGRHVRKDRHREPLTGAQLAARIKNLLEVMRTHRSGFSSPCQMAVAFHNQRAMDNARQQHASWLGEKDALSRRMADCLRVDPDAMAQQLGEQRRAVLRRCQEEMKQPEEALLMALELELTQEAEIFLQTYSERHQHHTSNQGALDRARAAHAEFLEQKDALSRHMADCLRVDPGTMAQQLGEQRRAVFGLCQEEMEQPEEALLKALEEELAQESDTFLQTYSKRHRYHTSNQGALVRAHAAHTRFLEEKEMLSRCMADCLLIDPGTMEQNLGEQRRALLGQCREEMEEPEEALLMVLELELDGEAKTFLQTYSERHQHHTSNLEALDRAHAAIAEFLRGKDALSQHMADCLRVDPGAMAQQLVVQRRAVLQRCREEMKEPEEALLTALELKLAQESETFLQTYSDRHQHHTNNQGAMDRARRAHTEFLKEKDGLSLHMADCLRVGPGAMAQQLEEQRRAVLGRCREEMKQPEEALLTALEVEMAREAETFLQSYSERHQHHASNQGALDRARAAHAEFLREKDSLSRCMADCLSVDLGTVAQQLEEQRRVVLRRCWEEMEQPEEALMTALEIELFRQAESFLQTYSKCHQRHISNKEALDRARAAHAEFLEKKDALSRCMAECLSVDPGVMAQQLEEQRKVLLGRCQEETEKLENALLMMLELKLVRDAKTFLQTYSERHQHHTRNQEALNRARAAHAGVLEKKDALSQSMADCLRVGPGVMAQQLGEQRRAVLGRCQEEMKQPEEALLMVLEQELAQEAETFLQTYSKRHQRHASNQGALDRARAAYTEFLQEKDALSRCMADCLCVSPGVMAQQLGEQRRAVLGRCREKMKQPEEALLTALEEDLLLDAESFLQTYRERYQFHMVFLRIARGWVVSWWVEAELAAAWRAAAWWAAVRWVSEPWAAERWATAWWAAVWWAEVGWAKARWPAVACLEWGSAEWGSAETGYSASGSAEVQWAAAAWAAAAWAAVRWARVGWIEAGSVFLALLRLLIFLTPHSKQGCNQK